MATGDVTITIRRVAETFGALKTAFEAKDNRSCLEQIEAIKKDVILFPSFLNPNANDATTIQEMMLTREYLELAALVSVRQKDLDAFANYYNQVRVYYQDIPASTALPKSERYYLLVGINLMVLLVQSRISQLHSELEMISVEEQSNMYIRFPVQLERYMMEGSYNKLLHARSQVPSNDYMPVVELLENTVRTEVAACIPKTYNRISKVECMKLLMVQSEADVTDLGKKNNWPTDESGANFVFDADENTARRELPFKQILKHDISFAAELQRVV